MFLEKRKMELENSVKKSLKQGKTLIGTMVTEIRSQEFIRMLGSIGYDYIIIDMEHSPYDSMTVLDLIRAAKSMALTTIVRVPSSEYTQIARIMDAGCNGVMIPHVEEINQIKETINAVKFPPIGNRSYGIRSIITDFKNYKPAELVDTLNQNTIIFAQIESKKAIDQIEDLTSFEDIDVAFIGPNDLAMSLGHIGEVKHPEVREAIKKVVDVCRDRKIVTGAHYRDIEELLYWKKQGMTVLTYSTDIGLMSEASKTAIKTIKEKI